VKKHEMKQVWVESLPEGWPEGWRFGPKCPIPPGVSPVDYGEIVLCAFTAGGTVPLIEATCIDRYAEETDLLVGQLVVVSCEDDMGEPIRCRVTREQGLPWSERLMLKIREFEPGRYGILENIEIDRDRAHGDEILVKLVVWNSQPEIDAEVVV
jgi:hypothetical protein